MSKIDFSRITVSERSKIAKRSGRNIGSEITLVLSAGFAALMVVLFWFGDLTFLPLAEFLQIRPTIAWVLLAALLAVAIAAIHGLIGSRRIAFARQLEFELSQFDEARKNQERDMKITMMRKAEQGLSKKDL
ncbi:hypothetical protein [Ruegeria sp. R14_0]|uniref:hypothetical protein n=1 Tax=Ruegeria sp. R14_0 TaxID=2821100 RepID=UPI001ADCBB4E|nr:hypothetical protein [Ruegeria sp. R14_0]MBO9446004.1 hypothetical protein [Ruegeria sp. R14_0]